MADGVQQMGLAKPRTTINKKRVIGLGRGFGNGESSRVGKAVGSPGHEVVEVVFGVQTGIKQDSNGTGFARVFLALQGRGRSDRIDIFWGFGDRGVGLDVWVDHHSKVGGTAHEGVFL